MSVCALLYHSPSPRLFVAGPYLCASSPRLTFTLQVMRIAKYRFRRLVPYIHVSFAASLSDETKVFRQHFAWQCELCNRDFLNCHAFSSHSTQSKPHASALADRMRELGLKQSKVPSLLLCARAIGCHLNSSSCCARESSSEFLKVSRLQGVCDAWTSVINL